MRFAFLALFLISCAPAVPLEGAKCPCITGWVCCPGLSVCAASADRCEAIPGPVVTPASVELGVGRKVQFQATGENVTWEVEDGLIGGSVEADGTYFAPPSPGLFHVIARSSFGARRVAITVRELRLTVLAGVAGGPSDFPIDGVGDRARIASPQGGVIAAGHYFFVDSTGMMASNPFSRAVLKRLDLTTRTLETVLELDAPNLAPITAYGPDHLLLRMPASLVEFDARTSAVRVIADWAALPLLGECSFLAGDGTTIYGYSFWRTAIIKYDPATGTERVLAGVLDTRGDQDGVPGLFSDVSDFMMQDGKLYLVDQNRSSFREVDPTTGTVTTLRRDPNVGTAFLCVAHFPMYPGPLAVDEYGRARIGPGGFAGNVFGLAGAAENEDSLILTATNSIRRFALQAGVDEVLVGKEGGERGLDDGQGERARFALFGGHLTSARGDVAWLAQLRTKLIRRVTRSGLVTTVFRDVEPSSIAAHDSHLYAVIDQQVRRAPVEGGAWESMTGFVSPLLLGVLDDGRVVVRDQGQLFFVDDATFAVVGNPISAVGENNFTALDPAGGVFFNTPTDIGRLDLATLAVTTAAATWPCNTRLFGERQIATARGGHLFVACDEVDSDRFIAHLDPAVGSWVRLVGQPHTGAVVPGPLPRALLHAPGELAVFGNGDLLVPDTAENVMLVVE